jgi:UDP-glucose 4-epimerase
MRLLVTGGAGYIGSHAVLALLDAGWPVAVIDNLTTGFRFAVPDGVPLYEGDIEDGALLARIFAEQGTRAVMHFAGSIVVPESVEDPLKYYHNNTAKTDTHRVAPGRQRHSPAEAHFGNLWRDRLSAYRFAT